MARTFECVETEDGRGHVDVNDAQTARQIIGTTNVATVATGSRRIGEAHRPACESQVRDHENGMQHTFVKWRNMLRVNVAKAEHDDLGHDMLLEPRDRCDRVRYLQSQVW